MGRIRGENYKIKNRWINRQPYTLLTSVRFSLIAQSCPTLCNPMNHSMPGLPVHHQLPEFTQTHVHWVGDAIQPSHPLSSPFPPAFNLSQHQSFSNESVLSIRCPKYWSFSFSISPSSEYSGLISFRMHWLDLLAAQGTLKSFWDHSFWTTVQKHQFFGTQLSLYKTSLTYSEPNNKRHS